MNKGGESIFLMQNSFRQNIAMSNIVIVLFQTLKIKSVFRYVSDTSADNEDDLVIAANNDQLYIYFKM